MMKHVFAALAICALPFSASASSHLAEEWGHRATDLYDRTAIMLHQIDHGVMPEVTEDYLIELERFSLTAGRLGDWIQTSGKSAEYACLYRSLAQTGVSQLDVLDAGSTPIEMRSALSELALMFADAERVAIASSRPAAISVSSRLHTGAACSVRTITALRALN